MQFKNIVTVFIFTIMLGMTQLNAQEGQLDLTKEQKELLNAQKVQLKKNRKIFKASLTHEQLEILKNKTLSQRDAKAAIMQSLSDQQKLILLANKEALKSATDAFRVTLTDRQKLRLRIYLRNRANNIDKETLRDKINDRRKRSN